MVVSRFVVIIALVCEMAAVLTVKPSLPPKRTASVIYYSRSADSSPLRAAWDYAMVYSLPSGKPPY